MKRRLGSGGRAFDESLFAQIAKRPGADTRQWVSMATIDPDTDNARSVRFKDDDGNPSPYGPLITVTLQPSGVTMVCRVSSAVAGDGEAEWYPFIAGDEVVVLILEGDERAGGVIVGRMNQEIDAWPLVVAGQDASKNVFGFRRMRTPFIVETAASYLIRSALTGSQIGIDAQGKVIINDGDQGSIVIGPDAIGLTSGDESTFVQLFPGDKQVFLGADSATFMLDADESKFLSMGAISFGTLGTPATGTAVTAEQVVAFVMNVLAQLATTGSFTSGPLLAATYSATPPASCVTAIASVVGPALLALGAAAPLGPTPGGNFAAFVTSTPPIFGPAGAITTAASNPIAPVDPSGTVVGFSRPGFKL